MPHAMDSPSKRAQAAGFLGGLLLASGTGTTSGTANTASTVAHGATDQNGNAYAAANLLVLVIPTSNAGQLYEGAATTATVIDIRSTALSVPYRWFLFLVN